MSKLKGIKWGEGKFTKAVRAEWNREYQRKNRKDPAFRRAKHASAAAVVRELKDNARAAGCSLCGYRKCMSALEFHHVGDKDRMISKIESREMFLREAAKCIVVCANCHREIHAGQIDGYENAQRAIPVSEEPPLLRLISTTA